MNTSDINDVEQQAINDSQARMNAFNAASSTTIDTSNLNTNSITKAAILINGLGSLGFAGGLFFAYKKQSHFWGYVGFGILGSIAGYAVGSIGASMFNFTNNKN